MANEPNNIAALLKDLAAIASQVNERADAIDVITDDEARAYFVVSEEPRDAVKLQLIAALSEAEAAVQRLRVLALVRLAHASGAVPDAAKVAGVQMDRTSMQRLLGTIGIVAEPLFAEDPRGPQCGESQQLQ